LPRRSRPMAAARGASGKIWAMNGMPASKQTFVGKPTIHLLSFPCFVAGFDRKTVEHFSETCLATGIVGGFRP
jgi:hypothetical protein